MAAIAGNAADSFGSPGEVKCDRVPAVGRTQPEVIGTDRTHLTHEQSRCNAADPISRSAATAFCRRCVGGRPSDCNSFPASAVGWAENRGNRSCQGPTMLNCSVHNSGDCREPDEPRTVADVPADHFDAGRSIRRLTPTFASPLHQSVNTLTLSPAPNTSSQAIFQDLIEEERRGEPAATSGTQVDFQRQLGHDAQSSETRQTAPRNVSHRFRPATQPSCLLRRRTGELKRRMPGHVVHRLTRGYRLRMLRQSRCQGSRPYSPVQSPPRCESLSPVRCRSCQMSPSLSELVESISELLGSPSKSTKSSAPSTMPLNEWPHSGGVLDGCRRHVDEGCRVDSGLSIRGAPKATFPAQLVRGSRWLTSRGRPGPGERQPPLLRWVTMLTFNPASRTSSAWAFLAPDLRPASISDSRFDVRKLVGEAQDSSEATLFTLLQAGGMI